MPARPNTFWKRQRAIRQGGLALRNAPAIIPPPIFTRPESQTQRPVNANSKDSNGYKRHVLGGMVKERLGKR
jgi:hypothetical protein